MKDFLRVLDSEIKDTEQAIKEATIKLDVLRGFRRKLESPGANGQGGLNVSTPGEQHVSLDPTTFTHDSENKTQIVLDIILKNQDQGMKAGSIIAKVNSLGLGISSNYVYSILNRQKKKGTIQHRRGKYYATLGAFAPTAAGGKFTEAKAETASE